MPNRPTARQSGSGNSRSGSRASLRTAASLDEALSGAEYVQESGLERLPLKQQLFVDLDARADPQVILASSTSAFDMTEIAQDVRHPERCVVAHPVNPPHTIPVVEVLGGARTTPEVVQRTVGFLPRSDRYRCF